MVQVRRNVVTLGGGHGQATAIEAVAAFNVELTAIPCVTDEGGCSGHIRREGVLPPPGDARRCLGTLARDRARARTFEERSLRASSGGRSVGNLMIAKLADGDLQRGCDLAGEWLSARGRVVPAALSAMTLFGMDVNGQALHGELEIERSPARIAWVDAEGEARPNPEAIAAIHAADLIVLGPGSFFTSVLAALSAPGIAAALVSTRARIVFFANLHSEGPQTEGMALPCYVRALREHVARWAGAPLGEITVAADGQRASWSALDPQTRLRRAPLSEGGSHSVTALLGVMRDVAGEQVGTTRIRRTSRVRRSLPRRTGVH